MAHIKKMTDKPRKLPWRCQIRRKGHPPMVKMFATKHEAEHWGAEQERGFRLAGLPLTIDALKRHAVAEIVTRYRDEITPTKGCRVSETTVLNKFLRHPICSKSLAYITRQDAYAYRDERLKETWKGKPIKASTVRREINTIQHIFEVAKEQWGFTNLQNPFRGLKVTGSMILRKRDSLRCLDRISEIIALVSIDAEARIIQITVYDFVAVRTFELVGQQWSCPSPAKKGFRAVSQCMKLRHSTGTTCFLRTNSGLQDTAKSND